MSTLADGLRATLLDVARFSILSAVHSGSSSEPVPEVYPEALRASRASFVTLHANDELRGCCGTLEPYRPLVLDVWASARAAACEDRRFSPVLPPELDELLLEISVLTPLTRLTVADEGDLLAQLEPGTDGLYLKHGSRRATFLPKVWKSLPESERFLRELKLKAGLMEKFWSSEIEWFRYRTDCFGARFTTDATCH